MLSSLVGTQTKQVVKWVLNAEFFNWTLNQTSNEVGLERSVEL